MEQIKKNPSDPDIDQINPEIVAMARTNGFLKQPMELFLMGQLTWIECLELAIIMVIKEFRSQNKILIETLREKPDIALLVVGAYKQAHRALPKKKKRKKRNKVKRTPKRKVQLLLTEHSVWTTQV